MFTHWRSSRGSAGRPLLLPGRWPGSLFLVVFLCLLLLVLPGCRDAAGPVGAGEEDVTITAINVETGSEAPTSDPALLVGDTVQLVAIVVDNRGRPVSGRRVKWTSSDPEIATVNRDGVLAALGAGSVSIAATAGKSTATLDLSVTEAWAVTVTPDQLTLDNGDTVRIAASAWDEDGNRIPGARFRWQSTDDEVATVLDGLVTGRSGGRTTIVARAGGKSAGATLEVEPNEGGGEPEPEPTNEAPVASWTWTCTELTCSFDGTGSTDDGGVASYAWTFGDGASASGSRPSHTYSEAGTYSVRLTVADDQGLQDSHAASVSVEEAAPPPPPPPPSGTDGIWISPAEVAALPTSGSAWNRLKNEADSNCGSPDLSNQDDRTNVCIMAKALVHVRIGGNAYRNDVVAALRSIATSGTYSGRALSLGRELAAYVIAADLIDLGSVDPSLDSQFRSKIRTLLTTTAEGGGVSNLSECDEERPNNWGNHCRASRAAVAVYLGDQALLDRIATVFRGYLGDRSAYAGFNYGSDLSWQCDPSRPVGINPKGCTRDGHSLDGVLPDDQRRSGVYSWPPAKENYVYEGLQGALAAAVILHRQGYDVFNWEDRALLRAFQWLHSQADFPAEGDDTWEPHIVNHYYNTSFPAPTPSSPGKNVGWSDWTHR